MDFDEMGLFGEDNYFVSGSNHAGEIRGLALSGNNVGVAAPELGPAAEAELALFAGGPMKLFVDSGAFSEVTFENGYPEVKAPISDVAWNKRLDTYERLARLFRRKLYVVAPDKVAFQAETLERLAKYASRIHAIRALGANVIVPVQKGDLSMADFAERALAVLGMKADEVVFGIPSKKDATSLQEMAAFAQYLFHKGAPTRVHLLGLGVRSPRYVDALTAILTNSPWTTVFSDSVRITAMVGRGARRSDGSRGPARKLTAATDRVKAMGRCKNATEWKAAALMMVLGEENREQAQAARRAGWFDPELESAPGVPLEPGCISYGPGGPFGTDQSEIPQEAIEEAPESAASWAAAA
jgi:hypothetical protein